MNGSAERGLFISPLSTTESLDVSIDEVGLHCCKLISAQDPRPKAAAPALSIFVFYVKDGFL
jgi:hypothetical protein